MYETFYGLSGKPFQLNPDPTFFFGSRGHNRAFAYLQYGLYQGEGFIVITGEIGAGKTTIVRSLMEQLDTSKVVAAQIVSTQLDADDLLRSVGVAFGLPVATASKSVLLASIEAHLCQVATENRRALLIVDEAQNLSPRAVEELRMLSNFQLGDQALLQSFLIGQPELRAMMQGASMQQLRQRVIASYHLGPLDGAETQAYVLHRLRHVGWNEDPRFTPAAFAHIHGLTGGIPRRINTLCNRVMLAGYLAEQHVIDVGDVQAIATEMQDELGIDIKAANLPSEPAPQAAGHAPAAAAPASVETARVSSLTEAQLRRLEERVERVERTVGATVDLLHNLLHPDRARPGTPPGRQG